MRKYKESNDILNTSDYFLFDGEEEIKEEKTDSFNKHQSKDNSGIEFFNPKTQILKKTNIDKFNFNSKNSNELMNSFELLGNLDTNRNNNLNNPKNENINNNIDLLSSVKNKINNDINNNINKIQQKNQSINENINSFDYIEDNDDDNIDNIDNNLNINDYVKKASNNNLQNIDNNIEDNENEIKNFNRENNKNENINNNINYNIKNNLNNFSFNNNIDNKINKNNNIGNNFNNINGININTNKNNINNINNNSKYQNIKMSYNEPNKNIYFNDNNNFVNNKSNFNHISLINNNEQFNINNDNNDNIPNNNIFNFENENKSVIIKPPKKDINQNIINKENNQKYMPIKVSKNLNKMNLENLNEKKKFNNLSYNSKTVIVKRNLNKSPFRIKKETEEERIKREQAEKEKKDIRNKLQCYLCFGKAVKARMCLNCKTITCEKCLKQSLEKNGKCQKCHKESKLEDFIFLPFMEDLTSFFINNVEHLKNQKNEEENEVEDIKNEENDDNIMQDNVNENINEIINEEVVPFCTKHKGKKIEYFCIQCNEYFCAKCLVFTNQEVTEKHKNHKIIEYLKLKKYNIKDAIIEYNKLKNSTNNLNDIILECKYKIKDLEIKRKRVKTILESIQKEVEEKYLKEYEDLNKILVSATNQKENIENSIDSVPNSFNNIIEKNDYGQGDHILEELKKLNRKIEENNELKPNNINDNLCIEWFESDDIKLLLPQGDFIEEFVCFDRQLDLIPEQIVRLKVQILGGNIVSILSLNIEKEVYQKIQPNFYVHFSFNTKDNNKMFAVFFGNIYNNGVQVLTSEIPYDKLKELIDNNSLNIKLNIIKTYYK